MCKKAPFLWFSLSKAFTYGLQPVGLLLPEMLEVPLLLHSVLHFSVIFVSCFVSGEYGPF